MLTNLRIHCISNKMSKSLSIIRYLRYSFPTKILKTLYISLVVPYISYCNIIWGSAFNTVLNPIIIFQKKCLRASFSKNHQVEEVTVLDFSPFLI